MENILTNSSDNREKPPKTKNRKEYAKWFFIGFIIAVFSLNIGTIFLIRKLSKLDDKREAPVAMGATIAIVLAGLVNFLWAVFVYHFIFEFNVFFSIVFGLLIALATAAVIFLIDSFSKENPKEVIFKRLFLAVASFVIVVVITILAFLIVEGSPAIARIGFFNFLFGRNWEPYLDDGLYGDFSGQYGIFNFIINSLVSMVGAVVIGGALGIFAAVFLAKFCPKRIKPVLVQLINLLAGIPSVVFGFFAMAMLLPARSAMSFFGLFEIPMRGLGMFYRTGNGAGLLAVFIVLAVMIIPITVALSRTSIEAVDPAYMEGALALGATKSQAVFKVVLPAAKSGVFAALVLGIGRAIGETMAVVMVQGGSPQLVPGLFGPFRSMTAHIVMGMGYAGPLHRGALVATGIVLLVFVIIINIGFNIVKGKTKSGETFIGVGVRKTKAGIMWFVRFFKDKIASIKLKTAPQQVQELYLEFTETAVDEIEKLQVQSAATTAAIDIAPVVTADSHFLESPNVTIKETQKAEDLDDVFSQKICKLKKKDKSTEFCFDKKANKSGTVFPLILKIFSIIAVVFAVTALVFIIFFVISNGIHHINLDLLFGEFMFDGPITLASSIATTFIIIGITSIISFPLGIMTAIYLVEYTKRGSKFVKLIRLAVETLAGIPSIVFGLFGMIFFGFMFGWGFSMLGGALTVSIMIIPATVRATEEALIAVPDSFREGSFALGAGKIRTVVKIILPSALPGILAAVILGIGRMVAESAALMFTAGASMGALTFGILNSGTSLSVALFYMVGEYGLNPEAFATASLLIIIILTLNIIATILVKKLQNKLQGKVSKRLQNKLTPKIAAQESS